MPDLDDRQPFAEPEPSLGLRVLVTDDDQDVAEMVGIGLARLGHTVVVANDGATAIERASKGSCDLAIIDLAMPGMDGIELARRLREAFPDIVIVAVTGYGDDVHRAMARGASIDHYMVKPLDVRALCQVIDAIDASPAEAWAH